MGITAVLGKEFATAQPDGDPEQLQEKSLQLLNLVGITAVPGKEFATAQPAGTLSSSRNFFFVFFLQLLNLRGPHQFQEKCLQLLNVAEIIN